jgi:hypothetical protein
MGKTTTAGNVKISFPVNCHYKGGNSALGKHGKHFWIQDGRFGHGEFSLSHSLPLADIASVEVTERPIVHSEPKTVVGLGISPGAPIRRQGSPGSRSKQITDIVIRTKDGQEARWEVEKRGGDWVADQLSPALRLAGITL